MMIFKEDGDIPSYRLDRSFATVEDALATGNGEIAAWQSGSSQSGFQIHDAQGKIAYTTKWEAAGD